MAGLNKVIMIGNLGHDPEIRYSQSGVAVANIRIGVTERRKEGDSWNNHTEWVSAVLFGKTAENAGKYLKKGRQVYVEGRLQTRNWTDKEGQTRYTTEVVANQVLFLGGAAQSGGESAQFGSSAPTQTKPEPSAPKNEFEPNAGFSEDDIPF